jgi:preprotein translocase subunit YajC
MWSDAWAQAAGSPSAQDPLIGVLIQLGQFVPLLIIMYLLFIRPQQQKQKQTEKMLKAVKKGDRVLTSGGIYGVVIGVDDAKAVLRIADETKVEFVKSAIVQVLVEEAKS